MKGIPKNNNNLTTRTTTLVSLKLQKIHEKRRNVERNNYGMTPAEEALDIHRKRYVKPYKLQRFRDRVTINKHGWGT